MPRVARVTAPGVLHHVVTRFVDRAWRFQDDAERRRYLRLLGRALARSDWRCLAYCLMSNHVHLAMIGGTRPLASWAKQAHAPFANWLNARHGRLGPVFADRPKVVLVPPDREAVVLAYIHNNPVRAKLAARARGSAWSSHRAYVGLAAAPPWLDIAAGLRRAGVGDRRAFEVFVDANARARLDVPGLGATRRAARRHGPYELATPTLAEPLEIPIVARPFVARRTVPDRVLAVISELVGVAPIASTRRYARGDVRTVKRCVVQVAMQLGMSIADAAAVLNVSRQRGAALAQATLSDAEAAIVGCALQLLGAEGATGAEGPGEAAAGAEP